MSSLWFLGAKHPIEGDGHCPTLSARHRHPRHSNFALLRYPLPSVGHAWSTSILCIRSSMPWTPLRRRRLPAFIPAAITCNHFHSHTSPNWGRTPAALSVQRIAQPWIGVKRRKERECIYFKVFHQHMCPMSDAEY
jgi:hypothetical protein